MTWKFWRHKSDESEQKLTIPQPPNREWNVINMQEESHCIDNMSHKEKNDTLIVKYVPTEKGVLGYEWTLCRIYKCWKCGENTYQKEDGDVCFRRTGRWVPTIVWYEHDTNPNMELFADIISGAVILIEGFKYDGERGGII